MQHLPPWMRRKTMLFAVTIFAFGVILLARSWFGHISAAPVPTETSVQSVLDDTSEISATATDTIDQAAPPDTVIVYVSGAVRSPDVYQLPAAARIKDLVLAAGGLAEDADSERINLAERLVDGQHIHVRRQGEVPPPAPEGTADPSGAAAEQSGLVNINTASAAELDGLPGIGQSFAQRIVEYRTTNGPFKSVEDLQSVKGIGPAIFTKIAPLVTVGP